MKKYFLFLFPTSTLFQAKFPSRILFQEISTADFAREDSEFFLTKPLKAYTSPLRECKLFSSYMNWLKKPSKAFLKTKIPIKEPRRMTRRTERRTTKTVLGCIFGFA